MKRDADPALLDAMLWSLRAEVECELRHLTKAQEKLHHSSPAGDLAGVMVELEAAGDCERTIRALQETSLREAHAITAQQQRPEESGAEDESRNR